jgi:transposase
MRKGIYQKVNDELRQQLRKQLGRNKKPSAGSIDSQSVTGTAESGRQESGFDGGQLVLGRKRHSIVDAIGYLIVVGVHAAHIADCQGAKRVSQRLFETLDTVKLIWADSGYRGE